MRWVAHALVEGSSYSSSCTLLTNGALRVVIDTGLSFDRRDVQRALVKHHLKPEDVDLVINTHLHVDHCGNNALFSRARIAMSRAEWEWAHAFYAAIFNSSAPERAALPFYPELSKHQIAVRTIRNVSRMARFFWTPEQLGDPRQFDWTEHATLPDGLELLQTPGHTPHHISILVHGESPLLVAGDAVLNESPEAKVKTMIPYKQAEFTATRDRLLQLGVRIVPGHGPAFEPRPLSALTGPGH